MQKQITENCNIFDNNGKVTTAGWADKPIFTYNKETANLSRRLMERDCYFINNNEVSLYLSIENYGIDFVIKIAVADLKRGGVLCDIVSKKFLLNKKELPLSDFSGELFYSDKQIQLQVTNTVDKKILKCDFIDFGGIKNLYFNINLNDLDYDSLNELAPFERDRRYFYFKRFMPCFSAEGIIRIGGIEYSLNETNARGYFDSTRFCKPRKHQYQRLSADCVIDGKRFSLCLASRVGDNRYGNENCFFVDGKLRKLSNINVRSTNGRLDRPWYFKAGVSAFDVSFKPFTVKGQPMMSQMGKTAVIFGRIYGTINHIDYDKPIVVDNSQAHMILEEF